MLNRIINGYYKNILADSRNDLKDQVRLWVLSEFAFSTKKRAVNSLNTVSYIQCNTNL